MKQNKIISLVCTATLLLGACSTPKLGYFQNVKDGDVEQLAATKTIKIQPGDKLSILVGSRNPELAYMFNLQIVGHYQSSTSGKGLTTSTVANYTVNKNGDIDFPILGNLHIAGLTREEISQMIKNILISKSLINDPVVTVDFMDMYFSVMGEVKSPGKFIIDHDHVTILDALSQAGDLTIYGKRNSVLVMREEDGKETAYRVDLTEASKLYSSPVFYLKQNDLIYVEPNDKRARESTGIGNAFMQPSLWISLASLATTIIVLIKRSR